jgi:hypothetical protein
MSLPKGVLVGARIKETILGQDTGGVYPPNSPESLALCRALGEERRALAAKNRKHGTPTAWSLKSRAPDLDDPDASDDVVVE